MEIEIIKIFGEEIVADAVRLSYGTTAKDMSKVIAKLDERPLYGGEQKHNEFIDYVLDITAPRYWWQQFDTYRVGVTKYSESTMHTIMRRTLTQDDFEGAINPQHIEYLNEKIKYKDFDAVKRNLPEGFLQKRRVKICKKTLLHIIAQRKNHRLKEWQEFCERFEK